MYLETGKSPITDEDEFHLPPPIFETCYNCFEKDLQTTKLIDVKNLKPFLFHLFRTDNKVLEDEEIKIHFVFEYNKLSNTFNTFFLNDDKKQRLSEQFTFCERYEKENLVTFCLEDNGDFANSKYLLNMVETNLSEDGKKTNLIEFTNFLAYSLKEIRNFDRKDFVACFWHIGQLSEDGDVFKCHCHFLYDSHIKKTDTLPKIKKQKEQEQDEIYDLRNRLKWAEQDKSRARKIRIIVFLIFIILYIIFPNAFWHVLSFIQDIFEFLHERIFNLMHKWF